VLDPVSLIFIAVRQLYFKIVFGIGIYKLFDLFVAQADFLAGLPDKFARRV
jgi:hypothetical protein